MITAPRHGERMRADWGADVARAVNALAPCGARGLVREGVAGCGAEPLPGNPRAMRRKPHVFEVFAHAEDGDSSPLLTIHLPAGCVWYGGESLVPDGVTALGASRPDEWEFDFESDLGETKTVIYLVISEDDYGEVSAEFVKDLADVGGTVKAVLPVAEVSIETVTEGSGSITAGVVHRQLARHPFTVGVGGGSGPEPTTYTADAVTGLSLYVKTDSNGSHLMATLTKKRLTVLGVAALTDEDVNVMDLEKVKLVSSSQYYTGNEQGASASDAHKFYNSTREVVVLDAANAVREENPVFEATPHSAEMDQPTGGAS